MIIRILLFPVILLLVLYFVIAHVVPTAKTISTTNDMIAQEEEKLAKAEEQLKKVTDFQQDIDSYPDEQDFVRDFVPNNQREEILLSDISQMAQTAGVSLFSVGFSENRQDMRSSVVSDDQPHLIEGKMIVSGTYESLKEFTHQLFHIKRLYAFKTFDLTKSEQKEAEEGEEEIEQELMLSGVISFAYGYMPGIKNLAPTSIGQPIDFDFIDTVMLSTAETKPLIAEPTNRENPFLP